MRRQEDLQVKLRERYRRLLTADHDAFESTARLVRDFISNDELLRALVEEAARSEPELDVDGWIQGLGSGHHGVQWPHTTEGGQATLAWALLQRVADETVPTQSAFIITGENNLNDAVRRLTETLIAPVFDYLAERVGDQSSVLHALERYVRMLEWFDRDRLLERYESDTQRGEAVYDEHLREFLFREGISMPFSQSRSPSGDSDALAQLETEDPLVCELKIFDGTNRGKRHIATGVHQTHQYAEDHGKSEAHLVIVNLSGQPIELPSDGDAKMWPRYIDLGGVRVYLIVVRGRRLDSASKIGQAKPTVVTRDDLVNPDVEG